MEEENRSWCSSSAANDQRAVTIECASDNTEPYAFKDVVYQRLIELCTDICKRNGKTKLLWLGDKTRRSTTHSEVGRDGADRPQMVCEQELSRQLDVCVWVILRKGYDTAWRRDIREHRDGASRKLTEGYYQKKIVRKTWADSKTQKGAYKILSNAKEVPTQQQVTACLTITV
ncbi:MAG: N-acetylmuramoyl-L-alanine amidase [Coprococcus sp.]